jgi:hypothetical protein
VALSLFRSTSLIYADDFKSLDKLEFKVLIQFIILGLLGLFNLLTGILIDEEFK